MDCYIVGTGFYFAVLLIALGFFLNFKLFTYIWIMFCQIDTQQIFLKLYLQNSKFKVHVFLHVYHWWETHSIRVCAYHRQLIYTRLWFCYTCRCIINCKEKLAVTSRMNVLAHCMDCTASEIPTYMWTLEENVSGVWTPIDLFSKTANGRFIIPNFGPRVFFYLVMHDLYWYIAF